MKRERMLRSLNKKKNNDGEIDIPLFREQGVHHLRMERSRCRYVTAATKKKKNADTSINGSASMNNGLKL